MVSLLRYAHIWVGLSLGRVASGFGKHVHPTEHCAPIMVLSGFGIPDAVEGAGLGVTVSLYSTISKAITNRTREMMKIINALSI
jgi:hypothetical protein